MATEHNGLSHAVPLQRAAARAVGLDEHEPGISRLGETLTPILDLWRLPDWAVLRGERLFARQVTSPIAAGRFSGIELICLTGSETIAVVRKLHLSGTSGNLDLAIDTGGALGVTATTVGIPRDGRLMTGTVQVSRCTLVTGDFAAGIAAGLLQETLVRTASGSEETREPWCLTPGTKLFAIAQNVNQAVGLSIYWTERAPFPGELQARG